MIGEDRDGVRGSLEILFPLNKGEDNGEELSIIYVIVAFGGGKGLGEVSAGVEVACLI